MSSQDLTTLSALKSWLGLPATSTVNDVTLAATITAASRAICSSLSRPALLPQTYTEILDNERDRLFLRHWPVLSIQSVILDGVSLPPAAPPGAQHSVSYLLRPGDPAPPGAAQALDLFGWRLRHRRQGLAVVYQAGYAIQNETNSVLAANAYAISALAPYGPWASDFGVSYAATGIVLTSVQTSPAVGQYSVVNGLYQFSAADAGAAIQLSYGYIPQDIAQAALELAAERFRAADRIGLRSKSLGGQETISYDPSAMPGTVLALLQPYRRATL